MLLLALLLSTARADCNDPDDAPGALEDCDEDGWTPRDGDCDDEDGDANPGVDESCDASSDEDCDGLFDEGCERTLQRGSLSGGSACDTGGPGAYALLALLVLRRRR